MPYLLQHEYADVITVECGAQFIVSVVGGCERVRWHLLTSASADVSKLVTTFLIKVLPRQRLLPLTWACQGTYATWERHLDRGKREFILPCVVKGQDQTR